MLFSPKKKEKLFVLLMDIATTLQQSTHILKEYHSNPSTRRKGFSQKLKELEASCDTHVHQVVVELNKTFITPMEREDILQLAMKMAEVFDRLEHCFSCFEVYSTVHDDEYIKQFTTLITDSVNEIVNCMILLTDKKFTSIGSHIMKIKSNETTGDTILKAAMTRLFTLEKNLLKIIQVKEIYERLEEITDKCQDVANALEMMLMKNS